MTLELNDILERIDRTEDERSTYRKKCEQWEAMWKLDAGFEIKDWREAVTKHGKEQVTTPDPQNVVNLGKRLISTVPKIDVPPASQKDEDVERGKKVERWLAGAWWSMSQQQQKRILSHAAWYAFVRGRVVFDTRWIREELPPKLKKTAFPIQVRTLDPMNVAVKQGPLFVHWAYHKYEGDRLDLKQRYPHLKLWDKPRSPRDARTTSEADELVVVDYWWRDNTVWNCVIVDDEFAVEPWETDYPEVPFTEVFGDDAPLKDEAYRGMSILEPIRELWPFECRQLSNMATGTLYYTWPFTTVENEFGADTGNWEVRPGATQHVPFGTRITIHTPQFNIGALQTMADRLSAKMQQATFPNVMYGDSGAMQAGYGVNILSDAAKGRVKDPLENLEIGVMHVNQQMLALVDTFAPKKGIELYALDSTNTPYTETLTRKDVRGDYRNIVTLRPNVPQDKIAEVTMAVRLADGKYISAETLRDQWIVDKVAPDEADRVWKEQAMLQPEIAKQVMIMQLAKSDPENWQAMLMGSPLEELARKMGVWKEEQPPMMPPPGMPPGMPPTGLPTRGSPGAPPGMPPGMQGPPMQPPMMPPGMPPGAPPPMQPPPELMGPMGGGIPPEMVGQLTPEGMGLSPNLPPELFAQMKGRPLPPSDELRALAGVR